MGDMISLIRTTDIFLTIQENLQKHKTLKQASLQREKKETSLKKGLLELTYLEARLLFSTVLD